MEKAVRTESQAAQKIRKQSEEYVSKAKAVESQLKQQVDALQLEVETLRAEKNHEKSLTFEAVRKVEGTAVRVPGEVSDSTDRVVIREVCPT